MASFSFVGENFVGKSAGYKNIMYLRAKNRSGAAHNLVYVFFVVF